MEEEKERKEYVMNETGRIWMGTAKNYESLPWVFGQVYFVKKKRKDIYSLWTWNRTWAFTSVLIFLANFF